MRIKYFKINFVKIQILGSIGECVHGGELAPKKQVTKPQ